MSAHTLKARRVLEELDHLLQLPLGLVSPGDVGERDLRLLGAYCSRPHLPERERPLGPAPRLPYQDVPDPHEQQPGQHAHQDVDQRRARLGGTNRDSVRLQSRHQRRWIRERKGSAELLYLDRPDLRRRLQLTHDLLVCSDDLYRGDIVALELTDQIGVGDFSALVVR